MKILEENINIYSSEMPAEAVESYERYYKNLNESTTAEHVKTEAHNDGKEMVESKVNDLCCDVTSKPDDERKKIHDNDSVKKRIAPVESTVDVTPNKKRKKEESEPPKLQDDNRDIFCWRCHKYVGVGDSMGCYFCPRVFHLKCTQIQEKPSNYWLCMECDSISTAENPDKIPPSLSKLQKKDLAELLTYVLKRMRQHEGSSHYENPVDADSYPDYKDYIIKPMYLSLLEDNVKNLKYSSCESFLADSKWMVHNSYVFNTVHSELTLFAKAMMKNAKHECDEIINCPDCYLHANTLDEDNWFIEPCEKPHILVWARLKGFPYWPCKVMKTSGSTVDVRFFGDHNKSLVPVDCCYLYSKQMPSKQKKVEELEVAIKEAGLHIKRLEKKFHVFQYAPQKTMYNPKEEEEQRKMLLPYHAKSFFIKVKDRDKLFDPQIVKNIFDEPLPNGNSIHQGEDKNKTTPMELSNEINIINKSNNIRNHNEEISSLRHPLININKSPPPLNKPIILVEDDDSDILSECPRQYNSRKYEKFNSSHIMNKCKLLLSEQESVDDSLKSIDAKDENSIIAISKSLTQRTNNINGDHLSDKSLQTNYHDLSGENLKASDLTEGSDLSEENPKSNENITSLISNKVNTATTNSPTQDKTNSNVICDKLRISSNAKLINVITDNPSLINNYIFKPMVVIQKLKDEVFRDYSNNMHIRAKTTSFNNLTTSKESILKKTTTNNNVENSQLNFNLLNGNISNLVNMTEIDLDKDESSLKVDNKEVKNGLKSIKTEKIEDYDDPVNSDYVKRLSESILESTSVCNPVVENNCFKKIAPIETEILSSTKPIDKDINCDEPTSLNKQDNSKCETILNQEQFVKVSNTATVDNNIIAKTKKVPDQQPASLIDEEVIDHLLPEWNKDSINENNNKIDLTLNEKEIDCDKDEHNTSLVKEQDVDSPIQKVNIICPDEKLKNVYHLKAIENTNSVESLTECDDLISNDQCKIVAQDNICMVKKPLNMLASCSNVNLQLSGNSLKKKIVFSESAIQNEPLINKKVDMLNSGADSDCEIVNIVLPRKSTQITKTVPVGYGRIKSSGGIYKKVIKNGVILPANTKRPNGNVSLKRINGHNLTSESVIMLSNSYGRNLAKASCQPAINKTISNINNFDDKNFNKDVVNQAMTIREEDNMMSMEIETILKNVEKIDSKENLVLMLREELKNFEKHCASKLESFKNAYIEEMDSLYNLEKQHWIQESMNVCENESKMMIDEIKKKQWCILCLNEAKYHCCWSTSYCSEKCQLADWPVHIKTCTQYLMKAGDPDLRFSPGIKKIFQDDSSALRELKIQDIIDSIMENKSKAAERGCSSGSSYNLTNNTTSNITSKSTVYVTKQEPKDRTQGMSETSGNHLVKIVPNQSLYVSGMASTSKPTKSVIHVQKHNPIKQNITQKGLNSGGVANNSKKSVLVTVPISNKNNNTLVSIGKNINNNNLSTTTNKRQTVLMGKQHFILPKTLLPTKIIKKSVPILTPKNKDCIQENTSPLMNSKSFYISMPNKTSINTLDVTNGMMTNQSGNSKILEKSPSPDRDLNKSAKSFLIVEKSGETSSYAYRIGIQEGAQPVHEVNLLPPTQKETASIALLSHPSTSNH